MSVIQFSNDSIFDIAIIFITLSLFCYTYWMGRLSLMPQSKKWKWGFRILSGLAMIMGMIRAYTIFTTPLSDELRQQYAFPLTALISSAVMLCISYAEYRFILRVFRNVGINREGQQIMNEIRDNVVQLVLTDKPVSKEVIDHYRKKNAAIAA